MFYKAGSRLGAAGLWGLFSANTLDTKPLPATVLSPEVKSNDSTVTSPTNDLKEVIDSSSKAVTNYMLKDGVPGALVCVSKDNQIVWHSSFGFCDVENLVPCDPDALMRIASISKSIFAATVIAPMVEKGILSLDSSVSEYLHESEFPKQKFKDQVVDTTIKQLLSHTSGIRSYLDCDVSAFKLLPVGSANSTLVYQSPHQYNGEEFYQREKFRDVIESMEFFKDDPLQTSPGVFNYTTYGYSVLSAVAQKVLQQNEKSKTQQIEESWMKTLKTNWGMTQTHLDYDEIIHFKRAKYYLRQGINGALLNAPYVDNSIKWAGGGLISTTRDLIKFGNRLIDCYYSIPSAPLKKETVELFWKEVERGYALGFQTTIRNQGTPDEEFVVHHSGVACGASSILLIMPRKKLVVAVMVNLGFSDPAPLAFSIADKFGKI